MNSFVPHNNAVDTHINIPIVHIGEMGLNGVRKPSQLVHSKARAFLTSKLKL